MTEKRFFRAIESPNVEAHIFDKQVLQVKASKEAGEEIYKPMTYIEIRIKGQTQESVRPLQESDTKRFPDAWRYYNGQEVQGSIGTPINKLEGIEEGLVVAFKSRGIHFIEDLARIQPEMIQGISMGVRAWQQKAQRMLGIEAPEKAVISIKEENDALRAENNELKSRIGGLEDKFDQLIAALSNQHVAKEPELEGSAEEDVEVEVMQQKKRGRKPKQ